MRRLDGDLIIEFIMMRKSIKRKDIAQKYLYMAPPQLSKKPIRVNPTDWYTTLFDLTNPRSVLYGQDESAVLGAFKLFLEAECKHALEGVGDNYENYVKEVLIRASMMSFTDSPSPKKTKSSPPTEISNPTIPTTINTRSYKVEAAALSSSDLSSQISPFGEKSIYSNQVDGNAVTLKPLEDYPIGLKATRLREILGDEILDNRIDFILDQAEVLDESLLAEADTYFQRMNAVLSDSSISDTFNLNEIRMLNDIFVFNISLKEYIELITPSIFSAYQSPYKNNALCRKIVSLLEKIWSYGNEGKTSDDSGRENGDVYLPTQKCSSGGDI